MNFQPGNAQDLWMSRDRVGIMSAFMSKVYGWMMLGISITGIVAYAVGNNTELATRIFSNQPFFIALIVVQLGAVVFLSTMIQRISAPAAAITFLMYSALTGLTTSMIFLLYTQTSIVAAFATTAIGFAGLSAYGFTTKRDLSPLGSFCYMSLFGLIGLSVISFFFPSLRTNAMQVMYSIAALVIFAGLTAYDTQTIKAMANSPSNTLGQMAILGALKLYLDFLNLFLNLLRLMGDRR